MDDVLNAAGAGAANVTDSIDDMLDTLETLHDAVVAKLDRSGSPEAKARFEQELLPKLEAVRKLVGRQSPMAKNALEDAIVLFREFHITSMVTVVTPLDDDGSS